jgi:hypothetical protein
MRLMLVAKQRTANMIPDDQVAAAIAILSELRSDITEIKSDVKDVRIEVRATNGRVSNHDVQIAELVAVQHERESSKNRWLGWIVSLAIGVGLTELSYYLSTI